MGVLVAVAKNRTRRKKSLLIGLCIIALLSLVDTARDYFAYRTLTFQMDLAHSPPHSTPAMSEAASEINDQRRNVRMSLIGHLAVCFVALGCLWDGVCIVPAKENDENQQGPRLAVSPEPKN